MYSMRFVIIALLTETTQFFCLTISGCFFDVKGALCYPISPLPQAPFILYPIEPLTPPHSHSANGTYLRMRVSIKQSISPGSI